MIMYITDYFYLHHPLLIKKPDRPNKLLSLLTSLGGWKERASSSFLMIKICSLSMSKCQNVKMYAFHLSKLPLVWS